MWLGVWLTRTPGQNCPILTWLCKSHLCECGHSFGTREYDSGLTLVKESDKVDTLGSVKLTALKRVVGMVP